MQKLRTRIADVNWHVRKHAIETIPPLLLPFDEEEELRELQVTVASLRTDTYWQVREAVACTLGVLGESEETLDALSQMVTDWRPEVVQAAMMSLMALGPRSAEAAEAVAAASTEHREDAVHSAGLAVFSAIAKAGGGYRLAVALASRLAHDEAEVRDRAVDGLVSLASHESRSVSQAIGEQMLRMERKGHARVSAVLALRRAGLGDQRTVKFASVNALLHMLKDEDARVRRAASEAIVDLLREKEPHNSVHRTAVLDGVISLLQNGHPEVRLIAIVTLEQIAPVGHEEASAALVETLEDADAEVRQHAAQALKTLVTAADSEAVSSVASRVGHHDEKIRECASDALRYVAGAHGDRDSYAAGLVSQHLSSSNPQVRKLAARELETVATYSDTLAVHQLLDFLSHEDEGVRADTVEMLSKLEPATHKREVHRLTEVYSSSSEAHEREAAVKALGFVADAEDAAVRDCLVAQLDDDSHAVRMAAVDSISRLYSCDAVAVGAIAERLPSRTAEVRTAMLQALVHIAAPGDEVAAMASAISLDDADAVARKTAVELLREKYAGGSSFAVKAAVAERLNHTDHWMRTSAKDALLAIAGVTSGDQDSIALIADVLKYAETWNVRQSASDTLLGVASDGEKSTSVSIASLVAIHDEGVWQQHLKVHLASLPSRAVSTPSPRQLRSPKKTEFSWLTYTAALSELRYPKCCD